MLKDLLSWPTLIRRCLSRSKVSSNRRQRIFQRKLFPSAQVLEDRTLLSVVSWDGGGDATAWDDALNWDTDTVPGTEDDVVIDIVGQDFTVRIDTSVAIRSLTASESIRINRSSLVVTDTSVLSGSLFTDSSTIGGSGDLELAGSITFTNRQTFDGMGTLTISAGATVDVFGDLTMRKPVENFGVLNLRENGNRHSTSIATFTNKTGANFNIIGKRSIGSVDRNDRFLINEGTITKSGIGNAAISFGIDLQNTGNIILTEGELSIDGGGSTSTTINVPVGTRLEFNNRDFAFTSAIGLTGAGDIEFNAGTFDFSDSQFLPTGTVEFRSGTTTIANTLPTELSVPFISGTVNFNADQTLAVATYQLAKIGGSGNVTLIGSSLLNGLTLEGTGLATIATGAVMSVGGFGTTFRRSVENFGIVRANGNRINFGNTFINNSDATFSLNSGGTLSSTTGAIQSFVNEGTFLKIGDGLAQVFFVEVQNSGSIVIESGELRLTGGGSTTTSIDVPADSTLRFHGGFDFAAGTELTGEGTIQFFTGVNDFSEALFLPTGTVEFRGGTTTIANTLPTELSIPFISGTVIFNADQTLDVATYQGAKIGGSGDLTLTGSSLLNRLTLEGTGTATISVGATMSIGSSDATFRRSVENFGTVRVNGNRINFGNTFINHSGAEFILNSGSQLFSTTQTVQTFINEGTFSKIGDGLARVFSMVDVQNDGLLSVEAGLLNLQGTNPPSIGRFDIAADAFLDANNTIELLHGGMLTGSGSVQTDVINGGSVAPGPGTALLTIEGDYTQTSEGTLEIGLAGTETDQFDQLEISGEANLGGTLEVLLLDFFAPVEGDVFEVLSGGIAGEFVTITSPELAPPLTLRTETGLSTLTLRFSDNIPPIAVDDFITVVEDTSSIIFQPLANDIDPDGDPLTITSIAPSGSNGNLLDLGNGNFQYVPFPDAFGTDLLLYFMTDGLSEPVPGNIVVNILPVNDAPIANPDSLKTTVDSVLQILPLNLFANDTDVDSSELSLADFTQPENGTLVLKPDGSALTYTPNAGFIGTDQFTYQVTDGDANSEPSTVEITVEAKTDSDPEAVRQALNRGIEEQRNNSRDYEQGFKSETGGLPFVSEESEPLGSLLSIGDTIDELGQSLLKTLDQAVSSFDALRADIESTGYTVECISGDNVCAPGEFVRLRFTPDPIAVSASLLTASLEGTPLAALAEQTIFSGDVDFNGQLFVDLGFGVDENGFFVTSDSSLRMDLNIVANLRGDVQIFTLDLVADINLSPVVTFASLDTNADQRLHSSELIGLADGLSIEIGPVTAELVFDATIAFLDYIDVDPSIPNRPHGGDPFKIRGSATLSAQPSQFDAETLEGLDVQWSNVRVANPDVDADGNLDYTPAVFLKNVLHLGEDLLSGAGILEYFSGVLGIDNALAGQSVPGATPNELPGGKLPDRLLPLADERAAVDTIDESLRALIIISEGPPPAEDLVVVQKRELRDWFLAESNDDVTKEEEQSVQFRIAKVAPILDLTIVPKELNDTEFDRLLIEALTDWIRWHEKVAIYGFDPLEILDRTPEESASPADLAFRRLLATEDALVEGLRNAVDRAIARGWERTDASGNTDIDGLIQDSIDAIAWSSEAARLGSLAGSVDFRTFDERAGIFINDVIDKLPFTVAFDSVDLTGAVDDATLTVRAGLRVKKLNGGLFDPIRHESVVITVVPLSLITSTDDVTVPVITRGSIDATGRFATHLELEPTDQDLSVFVNATFLGFGFDQVQRTIKGDISIIVKGNLPVVDPVGMSLREGPITVPTGQDVQIVVELRRGNRILSDRQVSFFLIGEGALQTILGETDRNGEVSTIYSAPVTLDGPLGFKTVKIGVGYFEDGVLHRSEIEILVAPPEILLQSPFGDRAEFAPPTDFSKQPPSEFEREFADEVQAILATQEESVQLADFSDAEKDGLKPFLKAWFEQAVVTRLNNAGLSDDAMDRALSELHAWKNMVRQLGFEEREIVPDGNPGGDLNNAQAGLISGLRDAIRRDKSRLLDINGVLLSTATSLAPLYDALRWSVDAELLGLDTVALNLTPDDIIADFGVTIELSNASLTGPATAANLSADVALQINGQIPSFDVSVKVSAIPQSFSTVGTRDTILTTQGSFQTTAAIGDGDRELTLVLKAGILGFDLAKERISLLGAARIELAAFAGGEAEEATPGPVSIAAGDVAAIQIDAFRGLNFLQNTDLELRLTGSGNLELTTLNTGNAGGGIVEYHPPVSQSPGIAILTVVFDDGERGIVSEKIAIQYTATSADSGAVTDDGALARDRVRLLFENLPKDAEGNPIGVPDEDELKDIFREWFRSAPGNPEVKSVQSRLDAVQPESVNAPSEYFRFRIALNNSIGNFQDWETNLAFLGIDPVDVFVGHELPGLTAEQELQSARDKFAPALRDAIVRQDRIVQAAGFDIRTMLSSAREVLGILIEAQLLGIDESADGLNIDDSLRNSLAFPTPDQSFAEQALRQIVQRPDAIMLDETGSVIFSEDVSTDIRLILKNWFLDTGIERSVLVLLDELQPDSPEIPSDYVVYANRLKKAIRNQLAWRANLQEYGLEINEVLGAQTDEFDRSQNLMTTALREAVDRVGERSNADVAALPAHPSAAQLQTVFDRAQEAVEWRDVAVLLDLDQPGSGLTEDEIVSALAFRATIVPDETLILTRDETGLNRTTLQVQAAVGIDGITDLLFSDAVSIRVIPLGRNGAERTLGPTDGANGLFSTVVSLGSNESTFRFVIQAEAFGLVFDQREIVREAPANIDLIGGLVKTGEAALSNNSLEVINGQRIRLRVNLSQGNARLGNKIVFFNMIGEGEFSLLNVRTDASGHAEAIFTPPANKIGRTKIVASFFQDGVLRQDVFDVSFTSTAADAEVIAPVSDEQALAEAQIGAILNQAAFDAFLGNENDFQAELIPPMRIWHTTGVIPRLQEAQNDLTQMDQLDEATKEYFNWRSLAALLLLDSSIDNPSNVAAELGESTDLLNQIIRGGIDTFISQAIDNRDGDSAIKALRLASFGSDNSLIDDDDSTHSVVAVTDRLGFEIVIDDTLIKPVVEQLADKKIDPNAPLELSIVAHVELRGVPTETVPRLPVSINPLGFSSIGQTEGKLIDGLFKTSINFGNGDRRLHAQITLGEFPFAKTTFEELSGPVEFVVIASRTDQQAVSEVGPLQLGAGQTATLNSLLVQGLGRLPGHTIEFEVVGEGTLSQTNISTSQSGAGNVMFTPPETGAGSTIIRAFVLANQKVETKEIEVSWDNAAEPMQAPPAAESPEAAGLFNGSHVTDAVNALSVPGSDASLGEGVGLNHTLFGISMEHLCSLVDHGESVADWADQNVELLDIVDFDELIGFFTNGLPDNPAELVRIRLTLDNEPTAPDGQLFAADFGKILPEGMSATVGIDQPTMNGQLVFGVDTSASPFYLLTQRDEVSEATTPINIAFGIDGGFQSDTPLVGTPEDPIFDVNSASLRLDSAINIDFSRVATDPELDGKLRFDNLGELANLRVNFDGDPLSSFEAIVDAELRIPGLKESSTSNVDAVIDLVGSVAKLGEGEPFVFEIRNGGFPKLPNELAEQVRTATPTEDDVFEDNDSPEIVAARPLHLLNDLPSPNLGIPTELTTLSGLSLLDSDDWFRFETTSVGDSLSFARIDFDNQRGDLDLALFRQEGDNLVFVSRDVASNADFAQVSLLSQPAGEYYLEVFDDTGRLNPSYVLRVVPPGSTHPGLDLSLGIADLSDLSFLGRVDSDGNFLAQADGTLTIPSFTNEDGTLIPMEFFASIDNDGFTASGTIDRTGETIVLGNDPILLEVQDFVGTIDFTIPFDGSPISGGLKIEAGSAVVTPGLSFNANVTGDHSNANNILPGVTGSLDFFTGAVNLDLHRLQANLGGFVEIDARPTSTGDSLNPFDPAVHLTFDPNADPTDDLLVFASLEADITGLPTTSGQTPGITLEGFGFQHNGLPFLSGASVAIPPEVFEDLGIPGIITISELGFSATEGRITGEDLVNLNFILNVSAELDLPLGGDDGPRFRAAVEDMTIAMDSFDDDNILSGIQFGSIAIEFGTEANPIELGAMSVFGGLFLENFDPTPDILDDPNSIILRIDAGVNLAGIGVSGKLLITEYGPIAAGLSASFGQSGLLLGPVALYEANALVLFNEDVPDLPLNDPLRLIEPGDGSGNEFDLSRFRRDNQAALELEMIANAQQFIVDNRNRAVPIATWNTPFLLTLGGTFGPSGQPKDTAAFLADVTIGANIDPDPNNPEVVLFGLGEAFVNELAIGTIGAVIELSDPLNPTFQIAFATPSPGSGLSEKIPAEIRLGATFIKDGDELRLDVVGDVKVLDLLEAEATGTLILDETGLFGQIQVAVGVETGGSGNDETSLDLSQTGADFSLTGQFELMFNFTDQLQVIDRQDRNHASQITQLELPADTTRLFVSGMLEAGGFEVSGAYLIQNDPDGLLVSAAGEIILGDFGRIAAKGGLLLVPEKKDPDGTGGAAGSITIIADLSVPGLIIVDGRAVLEFNSFNRPIPIEIPKIDGSGTEIVTVESGPFFFVRIAGANDPTSPAQVSLFPTDGELFLGADRIIGLDFEGFFELTVRGDDLDMSLEANAVFILFDTEVLGAGLTANFTIENGNAYGDFRGNLTFGDIELGHIEGELDRFGCLHTNIFGFEHIGSGEACSQKIFIENQEFQESSGSQEIEVELTFPAVDDLTVTVVPIRIGSNGAEEGDHFSIDKQIVIPRGETTGRIPVTFFDDETIERDRAFHLRVSGRYPNGRFLERPDIEGDITIFDDDTPPLGPPVSVFITPAGNLKVNESVQEGQPIEASINENTGPVSFQFIAPDLQQQDSVRIEVRLLRVSSSSGPLNSDFAHPHANVVVARETFTLEGPRPVTIKIPLVDDDIAEFHEEFRLRFIVLRDARFAPTTSLQTSAAIVTAINDDPERPDDAVLFYNFEKAPVVDPSTGTADYPFTDAVSFTHDRLIASEFIHSTGPVFSDAGLPKLEPTAVPDDETPAAGATDWTNRTGGVNRLQNPSGENGLQNWIELAGDWSNRLLSDPQPFAGTNHFNAGRLTASSTNGTNVLLQTVSLEGFQTRIQNGDQTFRLAGQIFSESLDASGQIVVEFFDEAGRSVGILGTASITATRKNDWIAVEESSLVPDSAVTAEIKLVAKTTATVGAIPVYFDDLKFSLLDVPFFEFEVTLDDIDRPLKTPEDFDAALGLILTGIDFWDRTDADGPTVWELRTSIDDFQTSIASGNTTSRSSFGHNVRVPVKDLGVQRPIGEPLRLRLYGLGANGGAWRVDNVALLGRVDVLSSFPLPPVANDDTVLMLRRDDTVSFDVFIGSAEGRDFDPNGLGLEIVGVGQPEHGTVELRGGGRIRYTRTDLNATNDSFNYTITENSAETDGFATATVNIEIVNLQATSDVYTAIDGEILSVTAENGLLANDQFGNLTVTDVIVSIFDQPLGDLTVNTDGSFTYVHPAGVASDSFSYFFLTEEGPGSLTVPVEINIVPDASRQANPDSYTILEDHRLQPGLRSGTIVEIDENGQIVGNGKPDVLANDLRGRGAALEAVLVGKPLFGELNLNNDGTFDYRPIRNFNGDDSFSYRIGTSTNDPVATVSISVLAVNDPPFVTTQKLSVEPSKSLITIDVSGTDAETPSKKLVLNFFTQPSQGSVVQTGDRTFEFTPPQGGLISETSFTFILRDDGAGGPGFGYSAPATVTISPPDGNSKNFTVSVTGFNGYIEGGIALLDLNDNRIADSVILDGIELIEPTAVTAADGSFVLSIPQAADRNGNGLLDDDEGRLILSGGVVSSTQLQNSIQFTAPANAKVITPLTTLFTTMVDEFDMTTADAEREILQTLELPEFDILHDITIDDVLAGDSAATLSYRSGVQVVDTVVLISNLFAEKTGQPVESLANAAFIAIASELRVQRNTVRLSDIETVRSILRFTMLRLNEQIDETLSETLAQVVAESNSRIEAVSPIAGEDFLKGIARIEQVALSLTVDDVRAAVRGEISTKELLDQNSDATLTERTEQAILGNTSIPQIEVPDIVVSSNENSESVVAQFVVRLSQPGTVPVSVKYETVDGTLSAASGAYISSSGILEFLPGKTQLTVDVRVSAEALSEGGTLRLQLSDETNAVFSNSIANGLILPAGNDDDPIPSVLESLAPNHGDGNSDGIFDMRQSNVVSLPGAVIPEFVTIAAERDTVFSIAQTETTSNELASRNDALFPFGEMEYAFSDIEGATSVSIYFDEGLTINTWYQFGPTDDNPNPHWFEFLFDGRTGAQLFDRNHDGFVEQVRLHFVDGGRGDWDSAINGMIASKSVPGSSATANPPGGDSFTIEGTDRKDRIEVSWDRSTAKYFVSLNQQPMGSFPAWPVYEIVINAGRGDDDIIVDPKFPIPVRIDAGPGHDDIRSGAGNDIIFAGSGNDHVFSGAGDDDIFGGSGNDFLLGGDGNDNLEGNAGKDRLIGGSGNDDLLGGTDKDKLFGSDGSDSLDGGLGDDYLFGDAGNDSLAGGAGNDQIHGGAGNDRLNGNPGDDILSGDSGDDILRGGFGNDRLFGGIGNDFLDIIKAPHVISPVGSTEDETPTIIWTSSTGATSYNLLVYSISAGQEVARSFGKARTYFTPTALLPGAGEYQVFVQASDETETSNWSDPYIFQLTAGMASLPDAPNLAAPIGTTSDSTPTVVWTAVGNADSYEMLVYNVNTGQEVANVSGLSGTSFTIVTPLAVSGQHQIFLRSVNSFGNSDWNGPFTFDLALKGHEAPLAPTLLNPVSLTDDFTPTFEWTASNDTETYELLIYRIETGQEILRQNLLTGTSFTPTSSLPGEGHYQVFLRATNGFGNSAWSVPLTFHLVVNFDDATIWKLKTDEVKQPVLAETVDTAEEVTTNETASEQSEKETESTTELDAVMAQWSNTDW